MKKVFLLLLLVVSFSSFAQKKKPAKTSKVTTVASFAKVNNLSLEMLKTDFVLSIDNQAKVKDTILLSKFTGKSLPTDCTIQAFSAKGTPLYLVSWVEKSKIESKLSTEDITTTNSLIVNLSNKSKVFTNKQSSSHIKIISYLDAKQTVSETIEKKPNEGYTFALLPDGDVVKKNKTKEIRLSYNAAENKFVDFKKQK